MQLKTGCIAVLMIFTQLGVRAQDFGYLGKKNLVSVSVTGNFRVFSAVLDDLPLLGDNIGYDVVKYNASNVARYKKKYAKYDLRVSYARQIKQKLAVGVEFSYEKMNMTRSDSYIFWSTPVFNSYGFMLTIATNSENKLTPIGYSSTIGIGPKFYKFSTNENYRFSQSTEMNIPYPDYAKGMVGFNLFWQPSVRIPVTKFMLIDVGIRLQTGFVFKNGTKLTNGLEYSGDDTPLYYINGDEYQNLENTIIWSKDELVLDLRKEALFNLGTFRLGLCFMF